jgi:virginiamycin B lyase
MRIGRLARLCRAVPGLAGRVGRPGRAVQRRRGRLGAPLIGPVAVLAGVPLLSLSLAAGTAGAAGAPAASGPGNVTIYAAIYDPQGITAGPDGALWFTDKGNFADDGLATSDSMIGRITTNGTVTNYNGAGINVPEGITAGPDGALWFTNYGNNTIGRITTTGTVTNYTGTGIERPLGITAGPDGALWFTESSNAIGRITTAVTPAINRFTPGSGAAGTTVTITGQNLSNATQVAFGGIPATIVSDTATQIVATVPSGAATGQITVAVPAGTATSHASFTVT